MTPSVLLTAAPFGSDYGNGEEVQTRGRGLPVAEYSSTKTDLPVHSTLR
jgi:hypothetical protein